MERCTGIRCPIIRCPMQYGYKVDECNLRTVRTEPMTNADRFRSMSDEEQQKCVRRFWEIEDFAAWLQQPKGE